MFRLPIDLKKAAQWGAVLSPLLVISRKILLSEGFETNAYAFGGYLIGSVIGGAVLFVMFATVLNVAAKIAGIDTRRLP